MRALRFPSPVAMFLLAALSTAPAARAQTAPAEPSPLPATLSVDGQSSALVYALDGGRIGKPLKANGHPREVAVRPGWHAVSGEVFTEGGRLRYRVDVNLEPGKHYIVYSSVYGYEPQVDIVERGLPRPGRHVGDTVAGCEAAAPGCSQEPAPSAVAVPGGEAQASAEATLETGQYTDMYGKKGRVIRAMRITSVDGASNMTGGFWTTDYARELKVKPGKHRVSLELQDSSQGLSLVGYSNLWFVAVPGGRYFAKYRSGGGYFNAWIQDLEGNKVGGIVGSEDEPL